MPFHHHNEVFVTCHKLEFQFPECRCANCSCIELYQVNIQRQLTYLPMSAGWPAVMVPSRQCWFATHHCMAISLVHLRMCALTARKEHSWRSCVLSLGLHRAYSSELKQQYMEYKQCKWCDMRGAHLQRTLCLSVLQCVRDGLACLSVLQCSVWETV